MKAGSVILRAGRRLRPQDIGLAASVGRTGTSSSARHSASPFSRPATSCASRASATPPGTVYDANRFTLAALLQRLGCAVADLGILPDRSEPSSRAPSPRRRDAHDAIITSGGVSTGEEDHVRAALEALGSLHFWRLAIKPGRPLAFGQGSAARPSSGCPAIRSP